jgi:dienelactone hydrolase
VFSPDLAEKVMQAYPEIDTWVVGGHSLGGAMAANYAAKNPGQVDGLVLLASYPAESGSLAGSDVDVISIYGSEDGLATGDKIDASRPLLPQNTRFVEIVGGNHAQFGWYGPQNGDGEASIERIDQQKQAVEAITSFLSGLDGN